MNSLSVVNLHRSEAFWTNAILIFKVLTRFKIELLTLLGKINDIFSVYFYSSPSLI